MEIKRYISGDFKTNTYVVTVDGKSIVIDPTLGLDEISKEIKNNYNVVAVLITHAHIDHIDGLIFFKDYPVYMSRIDYQHINDGKYTLYAYYMLQLPFNINEYDVHLLEDGSKIDVLGKDIKVMLTPGHTLGGVTYVLDDLAFTGDTLFKESVGRTDFLGGSESEILKSIIRILDSLDDNVAIYPGHGDSSTVYSEKNNNQYYLYAKNKFNI